MKHAISIDKMFHTMTTYNKHLLRNLIHFVYTMTTRVGNLMINKNENYTISVINFDKIISIMKILRFIKTK